MAIDNALMQRQAEWEANVERLLGGRDSQQEWGRLLLDREWLALRAAQVMEMGGLLSPVARLRLTVALKGADPDDATLDRIAAHVRWLNQVSGDDHA